MPQLSAIGREGARRYAAGIPAGLRESSGRVPVVSLRSTTVFSGSSGMDWLCWGGASHLSTFSPDGSQSRGYNSDPSGIVSTMNDPARHAAGGGAKLRLRKGNLAFRAPLSHPVSFSKLEIGRLKRQKKPEPARGQLVAEEADDDKSRRPN